MENRHDLVFQHLTDLLCESRIVFVEVFTTFTVSDDAAVDTYRIEHSGRDLAGVST